MRILFLTQGFYGSRIAENVRSHGPRDWNIHVHTLPRALPQVIDDPAEFLPPDLPPADLVVSLPETPGAAQIIPDVAASCGARAVLAAVDDRQSFPLGLENQVRKELERAGIAAVFAMPLCSFAGGPHPLLEEFARHFGRPAFQVEAEGDRVKAVAVLRDAPCGSARFVASILPGIRLAEAADTGALRHHHHPCLASMEILPEMGDSIMHLSGYLVRETLKEAIKRNMEQYEGVLDLGK